MIIFEIKRREWTKQILVKLYINAMFCFWIPDFYFSCPVFLLYPASIAGLNLYQTSLMLARTFIYLRVLLLTGLAASEGSILREGQCGVSFSTCSCLEIVKDSFSLNLCFISEVPWDNRECTRNWNFTVILPSGDGDCLLSYLLLQPCSVRSGPNRLY